MYEHITVFWCLDESSWSWLVVSGQEVMIGSVNLGMGMGILNLTEVAAVSEGGVLGTAFYSLLERIFFADSAGSENEFAPEAVVLWVRGQFFLE